MALSVDSRAPHVPGATSDGPHVLVFYKVSCPTCQVVAPAIDVFERAYPGRLYGVGQDPIRDLVRFADEFGVAFPSVSDSAPYEVSNAYEIEHVPTMFIVDAHGMVADVVESWDRAGFNRASATLAALLGVSPVVISNPQDGLPEFRPG
jgi:peroxiredoxin